MNRVGTDNLLRISINLMERRHRQDPQGDILGPARLPPPRPGDRTKKSTLANAVSGLGDHPQDGLDRVSRPFRKRLDLDVHEPVVLPREGKSLGQSRNHDPARLVVLATRPDQGTPGCRSREPSAGRRLRPRTTTRRRAIEPRRNRNPRRETRRVHAPSLGKLRRDVGGSQQRLIVEHDRNAVASELNVELPGVRAGFPAQTGRLECVLGCPERIAPMRDDHRMLEFPEKQFERNRFPDGANGGFGNCDASRYLTNSIS